MRDLAELGLWNEDMRLAVIAGHGTSGVSSALTAHAEPPRGSVQCIEAIPQTTRDLYRTGWEIEPFAIIDMAGDRAPYIEQSQSTSLSIAEPSTALLVSAVSMSFVPHPP